jgi:hypothetical protein
MNWKGTRDPIKESLWADHAKNDREQLVVAKFMGARTEIQEHRNLFIDAVHTIQICDKLPSEIWNEHQQMMTRLRDLIWKHENHLITNEEINDTKEIINKIENGK